MQHQESVVDNASMAMETKEGRRKDEERMKLVEAALQEVGNIKKVRHPHTIHHIEKKMADKGIHRMDRHPGDGLSLAHGPPKSGHGGKFTWEGPIDAVESELDPLPPTVDPRDPNYVPDDDVEEAAAAEKPLVIGEVEVAKVAEAKEGVSRIEVHPTASFSTAER